MIHYEWSDLKNAKLKAERDVCFEDVLIAITENRVLSDEEHPNRMRYHKQRILIVEIDDYAYLVPYIQDDTKVFFKTLIPSRRATKKYLRGGK
jgi:hypothetical protein